MTREPVESPASTAGHRVHGANRKKAPPVVLFLHLPKTAGTTLTNCVYFEYAPDDPNEYWQRGKWLEAGIYYFPRGIHEANNSALAAEEIRTLRRNDVRAVVGHFSFGIHEFVRSESTYLTVLRDPVDRVVSLYHHSLREPDDPFHERVAAGRLSLEEFVSARLCKEADNGQTRRLAGVDPPPGSCSRRLLDRAKQNLHRHFAVVGLTERFDETVILLRRRLGWKRTPHYLPGLVNTRKPEHSAIDPDVLAIVAESNELDTALYEYARGLFEQALAAEGSGFEAELEQFRIKNEQHIRLRGWKAAY